MTPAEILTALVEQIAAKMALDVNSTLTDFSVMGSSLNAALREVTRLQQEGRWKPAGMILDALLRSFADFRSKIESAAFEREVVRLTGAQKITEAQRRRLETKEFAYLEDVLTADDIRAGKIPKDKDQLSYTWISIVSMGNIAVGEGFICIDCLKRHGQTMTLGDWKEIGLPACGGTACRGNCRCKVVPAIVAATKTELNAPLLRAKKLLRADGLETEWGLEIAIPDDYAKHLDLDLLQRSEPDEIDAEIKRFYTYIAKQVQSGAVYKSLNE